MTKRATSRKIIQADEKELRRAVVDTARAMSASGLSPGRSGNVSCRFDDGMLITPTGKRYDETKPGDVVYVAGDGTVPGKQLKPSSEWQFHLAAYRARPDRNALVHTHSLHATALACARKPIPAFHYMVAVAGGSTIPCVPYSTFGSDELAAFVADGLSQCDACLMASHGQVALGTTLPLALELAHEVETLAAQYLKALMVGPVTIIDADEMAKVVEKFKSYGQKAEG